MNQGNWEIMKALEAERDALKLQIEQLKKDVEEAEASDTETTRMYNKAREREAKKNQELIEKDRLISEAMKTCPWATHDIDHKDPKDCIGALSALLQLRALEGKASEKRICEHEWGTDPSIPIVWWCAKCDTHKVERRG